MKKIVFLLLVILAFPCMSLETGYASWYGLKFHGRLTASGEVYDMYKLTAAHKTLPFGTFVRVMNTENGKSIVVKINDRGPFVKGRIIDLSKAAAEKIDMIKNGVAKVSIEIITDNKPDENKFCSIQVGSYSVRENAEKNHQLLAGEGFEVSMEQTGQGNTRVIVRNIRKKQLPGVLEKLKNLGYINVLVKEDV